MRPIRGRIKPFVEVLIAETARHAQPQRDAVVPSSGKKRSVRGGLQARPRLRLRFRRGRCGRRSPRPRPAGRRRRRDGPDRSGQVGVEDGQTVVLDRDTSAFEGAEVGTELRQGGDRVVRSGPSTALELGPAPSRYDHGSMGRTEILRDSRPQGAGRTGPGIQLGTGGILPYPRPLLSLQRPGPCREGSLPTGKGWQASITGHTAGLRELWTTEGKAPGGLNWVLVECRPGAAAGTHTNSVR